jgi:tetratricopeptide (TPR) repeat protein
MKKITCLGFTILFSLSVFSQESYEVLFVKGEYEKILQNSGGLASPDEYYWNSMMLDRKGETLKAIEILEDGLSKYAEDPILEELLIDLLYKTGQFTQAKNYLLKHIDSSDMFLKYMNILGFEREYQIAINYLTDKIITDSLNLEYLSLLGDYYHQIDSLKSAINAFEKLKTFNPNDQNNLNKLANLYIKDKDFFNAIGICDRVLSNDSINKKFIRLKGIAGFNNNDFDMAANCFQRIYDYGDSGKFVLKHLGVSEFRVSMFHESRKHLLVAYQRDSNDFEINYFLGKAYLNSPTPEAGIFYLDRVDSLLQPDPKIISTLHNDKQMIYSAIGNYSEALKSYEMAYKYHPKPEYLFYMASLCQYMLDNKKKAIEYYELFLSELDPKPDSGHTYDEKQITISLKSVAEANINELKKELFFDGGLD